MRMLSYTLSQKKQKKIKVVNTNREQYLNHPTLIDSNYNNTSGININKYINITNKFIQNFDKFISNTSTQDLSIFFDIEIKNISTNLLEIKSEPIEYEKNSYNYESVFMKINKKYKNNYNFISENENINMINNSINKLTNNIHESFNILNNIKSPLSSFILSDNNKKYYINNSFINLNINIKNPINFTYENGINDYDYDYKSHNYMNLSPIDIDKNIVYENIIYEKNNNNITNDVNIFSFEINIESNNSHILLNNFDSDDISNLEQNYIFQMNSITNDIFLEKYTTDDFAIIDKSEFNMNTININKLDFLENCNTIDDSIDIININININNQPINFDKNINYNCNFDEMFYVNKFDIHTNKLNLNSDVNIDDPNKSVMKNIFFEGRVIDNNLKYLNGNENENNIFSEKEKLNYEPLMTTLKINNKINMISLNNENIKLQIKENENENKQNVFELIDTNLNLNIDKFIPKEQIIIHSEEINLELNIDTNAKNFDNFLSKMDMNSTDLLKEKNKYIMINELRSTCGCIINVYQLMYNENKVATGLGDFIRGSYFLIDFCTKYNFKYFIDLYNHPIKFFLKKYNKNKLNDKMKNIYKKINKFEDNNFNPVIDGNNFINNYSDKEIYFSFLKYLTNEEKYNKNVFIYSIAFPNEGIVNTHKKIMRDIFEPTNQMELLTNIKLKMLNLKSQSYEVIHIRCGDEYLFGKNMDVSSVNIHLILSELDKLNINKKYLLISDNNSIKTFIKEKYNFINILYHDIVHTGENSEIIVKKLENTMLDFYLMSKSKNIMAYSVYHHGSGFSKWCAFTYDIPYYCKYFGI